MNCSFDVWKLPSGRHLVATAAMLSLLGSAMAANAAIVPVLNSSVWSIGDERRQLGLDLINLEAGDCGHPLPFPCGRAHA
jgi:hypothetical protein